jgi:hypothetical protein
MPKHTAQLACGIKAFNEFTERIEYTLGRIMDWPSLRVSD